MALRHADTVAGAALTLAGSVALLLSLQIRAGPAVNTLPAYFFPLLCAAGIMLLGTMLLIKGLRSEAAPLPKLFDWRVVTVAAIMLVYFLTFEHVDFRFGSWLFALVTMMVMGNRSVAQLVVIPFCLSAAVFAILHYGFNIMLPTWI